jgi:hypothetical protein
MVLVVVVLLAAQLASATVPHTISYQGILTDANDVVVADGDYDVTFRLYTADEGGTPIWEEALSVAVISGRFDVVLGNSISMDGLNFDAVYWLALKVEDDPEMTPRIELAGAPYSLNARTVEDDAITATKIPDGTVVRSVNGQTDDVIISGGLALPYSATVNTAADPAMQIVQESMNAQAAVFEIDQVNASKAALRVESNSYKAQAAHFEITRTTNTQDVLRVISNGSGIGNYGDPVGSFMTIHPSVGIHSIHAGTGCAGIFENVSTNTTEALLAIHDGSGIALNASSAYGSAANFSADSPDFGIKVTNNGAGPIIVGRSNGVDVFEVQNDGRTVVSVLEITGGSDLAEPFPMTDGAELSAGALVVIDEENPGNLKTSVESYDTKVAGIVSGAGGVRPGITLSQNEVLAGDKHVALSGRVYALADASYGAIEPGDLLTTSDTPGYAMKATDHRRTLGAVVGKAMTGLESGRGLVLVLVSLQ